MSLISHPNRRAVMVGTGAVLAAGSTGGCLPRGSNDEGPSGAPDPDRQRVESIVAQIEELLALLAATVLAHPRLSTRLTALRECHAAHLRVLDADAPLAPRSSDSTGTPSPSTPPTGVPTSARAALTRLRTTERAHAAALVASASISQSGALARLFAVMAAGVDQHMRVVDEVGAP